MSLGVPLPPKAPPRPIFLVWCWATFAVVAMFFATTAYAFASGEGLKTDLSETARGASNAPFHNASLDDNRASERCGSGERGTMGERDVPDAPETPGEMDDDLEDERESEFVIHELDAAWAIMSAELTQSPARLFPPRHRCLGTLDKPPRA